MRIIAPATGEADGCHDRRHPRHVDADRREGAHRDDHAEQFGNEEQELFAEAGIVDAADQPPYDSEDERGGRQHGDEATRDLHSRCRNAARIDANQAQDVHLVAPSLPPTCGPTVIQM